MSRTSDEALFVARINTNLQAISANIYRLAGDPRPEARGAAEADIKDELDSFKKRFTALNELVVSADNKARLAKILSDMDALNGALKNIYQAADGVQNFQMTQEMQQVRDAAGSASKLVGTLRNALRGMMEIYGKRVIDVNNDASEAYLHVSTLMMICAAVSIIVSLMLGFCIGQYGVAKPVRALVILLQKLAGGDYDVEVQGTDRKDEIGDVAKTAVVFKENGLAKIRMEREQKELEKKAVAEREAAAAELANEFEAAVGGIVQAAVAGDFSKRVELEGKTGLILSVGKSINTLCENVGAAVGDLVAMLTALAKGDMTRRITSDYQGGFGKLKDNANATAQEIGATIAGVKQAAREVTNASAEISTSTTDLSQRTEEQAASLEQTSASMEEIASTVKRNAENAQEANQSAADTRESPAAAVRWSPKPSQPWPASRNPRARSPILSVSSMRSPGRPICWRSMPRSRRRAPAKPAAALPWWLPKCAAWRSARRRPPKISRTSSPTATVRSRTASISSIKPAQR